MLGALFAALLLNPPATADVPVITPAQARDHVGREVVVRGQVAQVGASEDGRTLFLNFGGRYPDHVFNAVILSRNLRSFPEARSLEGKIIRVRGKIQRYKGKGKPEIVLERQEQVTIDLSATLPRGAEPGPMAGGVEGGVVSGVQGGVLGGTDVEGDLVGGVPGGVPGGTGAVLDYDSPPRPIKITRPHYPQEAFVNKIEGTVVVEIIIDSQGRVTRARVIHHSIPSLDAAALETVYQWVFQPAVKHGRPVPTIAHAPITFRIYTKEEAAKQRTQRPVRSPN